MITMEQMYEIGLESGFRVFKAKNRSELYFFTKQEIQGEITMEDCTRVPGCFVFGPMNRAVDGGWFVKAAEMIEQMPNTLFLWLETQPDGSVKDHRRIAGIWGSLPAVLVEKEALFEFGSCRLRLGAGIQVNYMPEIPNNPSGFHLYGDDLSFAPPGRELQPLNELFILADEFNCGSVRFQFSPAYTTGQDFFKSFDIQMKYAMLLPEENDNGGGNKIPFQILSRPLFKSNFREDINVTLEPLHPQDADKTYFHLGHHEFDTSFVTPAGRPVRISLSPNTRFVFEKKIVGLSRTQEGRLEAETDWYLCPSGTAELLFPSDVPAGEKQMLCGLSGTEYVQWGKDEKAMVEFIPNQNAFCLNEPESDARLSALATTCWIRFPDGIRYYDPPETACLFQPGEGNALKYVEFAASEFHGRSPAVPMLPYWDEQGIDVDTVLIKRMEGCVYQARRQRLAVERIALTRGELTDGADAVCVTPQGVVVGVDETFGTWRWVGLGKNSPGIGAKLLSEKPERASVAECARCADNRVCRYTTALDMEEETPGPTDPDMPDVRLEKLSGAFRKQLQQKEIFIVFESPNEFLSSARPSAGFQIDCDGWSFLIHPKWWRTGHGRENTLMLIKYGESYSIRERMRDSQVFQEAVNKSLDEQNRVKKGFEEFTRIIDDPGFQGTLFLNCPVASGQELPDSLKILTDGVTPDRFNAHYLAFTGSRVHMNGAKKLVADPSSVFGLVQYRRDETTDYQEQEPDLDFSLVELSFSIENSTVQNISSVSELLIHSLFGAPCKKVGGSNGAYLLLDGSYHQVKGTPSYFFSLREGGEYQMSSSAVSWVRIDRVEYSADQQDGGFLLGGRMFFRNNKTCDLFSFGVEEGGSEKMGLAFDGLRLIRSGETGPQDAASEAAARIYADYSMIRVLPQESQGRKQSFGERFACAIAKIIVQEDGKTPDDLGYRSITCPIQQDTLRSPWCGLVWEINLGTLGSLSKGDPIILRLLTASSANETGGSPAYYIGVQLPAALGGDGLDFQGLIKLGFHSVSLASDDSAERNYTLRLHNFTLRLLGLSLPPGANDIFLFSDGKDLGWYAGYLNEK